jgi:hypothetical protein
MFSFIFAIFNGFVISYPNMRVYWRWLNRLVPSTWILAGVASSQLGNLEAPVTLGDGSTKPAKQFLYDTFGYDYDFRWGALGRAAGAAGTCAEAEPAAAAAPARRRGPPSSSAPRSRRRWNCLLIVAAYFVFFRVTSTLALRYCNFLRR